MKNNILPAINKLIMAFIALLGFSCEPETFMAEYGMPSASFKAYGSIVDESTLEKLVNIEVAMLGDTVYSDENGEYVIKVKSYITSDQIHFVSYNDVDGALNGVYNRTDTVVDFTDVKYVNGDDSWYSGEKSIKIDVKLKQNVN